MTLPPGFKIEKPNQVYRLLKSLYSLKQASRKWYERLTSLLVQHGYTQVASDHSIHQNHPFIIHSFTGFCWWCDSGWKLPLWVFFHKKCSPHFISNQGFRPTQIFSWYWSSSFQSWHLHLLEKILLKSSFWFKPSWL